MEAKDGRQDVRPREEKHTGIYNFLCFLREGGGVVSGLDLETWQPNKLSYISTQPAVREIKVIPALRVMTRTGLSFSARSPSPTFRALLEAIRKPIGYHGSQTVRSLHQIPRNPQASQNRPTDLQRMFLLRL